MPTSRMVPSWHRYFQQHLEAVAQQQRLRHQGGIEGDAASEFQRDSGGYGSTDRAAGTRRRMVDFSSNDYLALRHDPRLIAACTEADQFGSGASPVLSGYTEYHRTLEQLVAQWCQRESALVFSSGYTCNLGSIACLVSAGDLILSDQLNHASIIDGCRLSRADIHVYPHGTPEYVEQFLLRNRQRYKRVLLITESVFSMDGDVAPLEALAAIAVRHDVAMMVDEAHAVGIYGAQGAGVLEELGLSQIPLVKSGTFSKALGAIGGYVVADAITAEYLVNSCRTYLFSTAPPPPIMNACKVAIELAREMAPQRRQLRNAAQALRGKLAMAGLCTLEGDSPIVPVILGSEERVLGVSRRLRDDGFLVSAIRPPTVPPGTCRLRISLSVSHRPDELEELADCIIRAAEC